MTIEDIKITIKNHIINSISHRDLLGLCGIFEIPTTGRRMQIQKRLIDSILVATNIELLHRILYTINRSIGRDNGPNGVISSQTRDAVQNYVHNGNINTAEIDCNLGYQINGYNPRPVVPNANMSVSSKIYCISNELLDKSPINLRTEIISGIDPLNVFIPNYTKYPSGYFNAPSSGPTLVGGRVNMPNVQLPYCVKNTVISSSQFYCCQVVLHPLCLLIPKPTPNICQPTRVMSKMMLQFTLSNHARHLITAHRSQINNKRFYKWQVLLRFGMYDPSKPFPNSQENVTNLPEYIPPYLTLFVNNVTVPLWDILPSNSTTKEGKRHPRPINISDYLKFSNTEDQGCRQSINVNWWQTPGVYQYYYFAIYLERKLAVNELYNLFVNKTHNIQKPMSFTVNFIKDKFSSNNQFKKKFDENGEVEDDDDLVISSVLPISLLCPIGKSRITCPLRGLHCQHLQCFDAQLYLMMNERRSVWKCPVCDAQATLNDLFVDEFFLKILQDFSSDEEITEVNVNPDGSYIPVAVKESREHKQHVGNIISNIDKSNETEEKKSSDGSGSADNQPVILLESDDEDLPDKPINSPKKSISLQSSSSAINECNETTAAVLKSSQNNSIIPSVTIDLTTDSEDEDDISLTANEIPSMKFPSNHNTYSQIPPVSHSHQHIAPKSIPNNFIKQPDYSVRNVSYHHPTPQNDNISISNTYLNILNQSTSSQSLNNIPPFLWMPQNQRFPVVHQTDLLNCYTPQVKPCIPAQNFVNVMKPTMSNQFRPNTIPTTTVINQHLLPRPIKIDPHLNEMCIKFNKNSNPPGGHSSSLGSLDSRKNKPENTSATTLKSRSSLRIRDPNARRSTRILNQHKKIYKENSLSDDDEDDDDLDSEDSDPVAIQRSKRRNAFEDSTSSSSSMSNRKRRRLVPDDTSSADDQTSCRSEIISNLKYPLVILNKLDPVVLKVYLQQNEVSKDAQLEESACQVSSDVISGSNGGDYSTQVDEKSKSNPNNRGILI